MSFLKRSRFFIIIIIPFCHPEDTGFYLQACNLMARSFQSPRYHLLTQHSPKQEVKNEGKWIFSSCGSASLRSILSKSSPKVPLAHPKLSLYQMCKGGWDGYGSVRPMESQSMPWGLTTACTESEALAMKHKEWTDVRQERKSLPQKS